MGAEKLMSSLEENRLKTKKEGANNSSGKGKFGREKAKQLKSNGLFTSDEIFLSAVYTHWEETAEEEGEERHKDSMTLKIFVCGAK